jgi:hypothetical protein
MRHSHDVIRGELAKLGPDGVESVEELADLMRVLGQSATSRRWIDHATH